MDSKPKRTNLYFSVAILNLVYLISGTTYAWSSPVLIKLQLSDADGSTVASMVALGMALGPFLAGALMKTLGRRTTVGLGMGFMTCSYVMLTLVKSVTLMAIARFMAGLTLAVGFSAVPAYIAEISEDSVRSTLNSMIQVAFSSGSLTMYSIGPYVSYAVLHYLMIGICAIFFLLFPFLPNSPYSLIMANEEARARETLSWLRQGRSETYIEKEFQSIQKSVQDNQAESGSIKDLFTSRGNRRALMMCCVILALQQISGISIVYFYTETIFKMTGTNMSSSVCAIIIGIIMFLSSFLCPIGVKHFGYKKPLLASATGCGFGMAGLGVFFMLKFNDFEVDYLSWLPLLSVVIYILSFNTGLSTVPWALSGELFPSNVKPFASVLITATCGFVGFLSSKLFPTLIALIGIEFLFLVASFFSFVIVVFVAMVVQETSGLSFAEIQDMLNGRKRVEVQRSQTI